MKLMFLVALVVLCGVSAEVRYDNFRVYRVTPKTEAQLADLRKLSELNGTFNFWTDARGVNVPVDIMVSPELVADFEMFINTQRMDMEVFIDNVQERIDNERPSTHSRALDWVDYYPLEDIYEWLDTLAEEFPDTVSVVVGGSTYEGREIRGVRVSFSPSNVNNTVFIEGGNHAREWISPATVTYILNELLRSEDESVRAVAERYDWYFFPVFNPDGYVYSHTTNRLWRLTRTPYGTCFGADPNRNWGYRWNTGGSSSVPCSETYPGSAPFSEESTRTMSEFISSISSGLVAYISFHSYSQLLMYPYGHTAENLENWQELQEIGEAAVEALQSHYGTEYVVGNIAATIYVATGSTVDWVKGTLGTRIAYVYELRDLGRFGFILPADQIIPSGIETLDSLVVMLNEYEARN